MQLRSGKVVTTNKTNKTKKINKIKNIISKNKKTQTDLEPDLEYDILDAAHALLELKKPYYNYTNLVNEKIKVIPKDLQDSYEQAYWLRKLIIESIRKGINIKFEKEDI